MFQIPADRPIEFRDGPRWLPDYLVTMLSGIDTEKYTYDQAIEMANQNALGEVLGRRATQMIANHFTEVRDGDR